MERVAEVKVRMAPGLCSGGVRGTARYSSSLVIFLRPSPELSVGDVGEAVGGEMILTPRLSVGEWEAACMMPHPLVSLLRCPPNYPLGKWERLLW